MPWKSISTPFRKAWKVRNKSMSVVDEDAKSFAARGPVISVSRCKGGDRNVNGCPREAKLLLAHWFGASQDMPGRANSSESVR